MTPIKFLFIKLSN